MKRLKADIMSFACFLSLCVFILHFVIILRSTFHDSMHWFLVENRNELRHCIFYWMFSNHQFSISQNKVHRIPIYCRKLWRNSVFLVSRKFVARIPILMCVSIKVVRIISLAVNGNGCYTIGRMGKVWGRFSRLHHHKWKRNQCLILPEASLELFFFAEKFFRYLLLVVCVALDHFINFTMYPMNYSPLLDYRKRSECFQPWNFMFISRVFGKT